MSLVVLRDVDADVELVGLRPCGRFRRRWRGVDFVDSRLVDNKFDDSELSDIDRFHHERSPGSHHHDGELHHGSCRGLERGGGAELLDVHREQQLGRNVDRRM